MIERARCSCDAVVIGILAAWLAVAIIGPATAAGETPKAWGAGSAGSIDDFTATSMTTVLD